MAAGAGWTTCSSSGCGGASNTRRSTSRNTPRSPICGEASGRGSTVTTAGGPMRTSATKPRPWSTALAPRHPRPHEPAPLARRNGEAFAAVLARHCATLRGVLGPPLQLPHFGSLATPPSLADPILSYLSADPLHHSLV